MGICSKKNGNKGINNVAYLKMGFTCQNIHFVPKSCGFRRIYIGNEHSPWIDLFMSAQFGLNSYRSFWLDVLLLCEIFNLAFLVLACLFRCFPSTEWKNCCQLSDLASCKLVLEKLLLELCGGAAKPHLSQMSIPFHYVTYIINIHLRFFNHFFGCIA